MTYEDHIKAIAQAYLDLRAFRSATEDGVTQCKEERLIPVLKAFYAFYSADIEREQEYLLRVHRGLVQARAGELTDGPEQLRGDR